MTTSVKSLCGALVAIALLAGACSSDDEATPDPAPVVSSEPVQSPDPTPSASEEDPEEPAFTAQEQEVADVFTSAFDTDPDVSAAAYAPDPELEDILVAANEAAEARGDTTIGVAVTGVTIEGELAQVAFNILLNGNVVAPSTGVAVLVDGEWKVHVSTLCGLLSLAGPGPEGCERVQAPA